MRITKHLIFGLTVSLVFTGCDAGGKLVSGGLGPGTDTEATEVASLESSAEINAPAQQSIFDIAKDPVDTVNKIEKTIVEDLKLAPPAINYQPCLAYLPSKLDLVAEIKTKFPIPTDRSSAD